MANKDELASRNPPQSMVWSYLNPTCPILNRAISRRFLESPPVALFDIMMVFGSTVEGILEINCARCIRSSARRCRDPLFPICSYLALKVAKGMIFFHFDAEHAIRRAQP